MTQLQADKAAIIAEHRTHETDTGSCEVQISILTQRIRALTEHLKVHKKDNHTRRGLMKLVGRRGRLLRYLKRQEESRYTDLIQGLGIRGIRTRA